MSTEKTTYQLIRRTCSRPTPARLTTTGLDQNLPSPRVPNELISHILELVLTANSSTLTTDFASIASFSLASVDFRQIALRQFFHDLTLITKPQWKGLFRLLEALEKNQTAKDTKRCFTWVKSLCASSRILSHQPSRLSFLTHLRMLSIDLAQEGLSTQHPCLKALFTQFKLANAGFNMTSLTLSNLPRIDVVLLRLIAKVFPRLTDLYLSCTERLEFGCCWPCFEDSLGCTIHSPIPDDYSAIEDMAGDFGNALKPLTYLTHLHLGVFLSDDQLLYAHIAHSLGDEENMGMVEGSNHCHTCFDMAVDGVRMRELAASIVIAQKLKAVRSIGWSSLFYGDFEREDKNDNDNDEDENEDDIPENEPGRKNENKGGDKSVTEYNMTTTIWVLRTNGRIRVRRIPWL